MGTRSDIIVKLSDGKWKRIYCHWDGYISHNGAILFEHYNSQKLAEKLVEPGDLSSLAEDCSKPEGHTFDSAVKGHCVYYGRDRGETGALGATGDTLQEVWPAEDAWTEFTYVWDGTKWGVADPDGKKWRALIPLDEALKRAEAGENPVKSAIKSPFGVLGKRA
jgi:hypothetical protein